MHTLHLFLMTTLVTLSLQSVAIIVSFLLTLISLLKSFLRLYKVQSAPYPPVLIPFHLFWANFVAAVTFPVSIIFSLSYKYSVLPFDWKCATVLSLFKKGDRSLVCNYRPIPLPCILCKIIEGWSKQCVRICSI